MTTFKVNDICIIKNGELYPQFNGTEVTIISAIAYNGPVYVVDLCNPKTGKHFGCRAYQLELKRRPGSSAMQVAKELFERLTQPVGVV